ncbi:MAG: DUF1059 domain-containing protein [Chitinophagaceae bacterium]|nr:DUF1059 domain-containing protein [Chitinophagaceae bacterium]
MKKMTCKQLGGACDIEFEAATFEEMATLSKKHSMAMFQAGDADHLGAMKNMQDLMSTPELMNAWFENKRSEFNALPDL